NPCCAATSSNTTPPNPRICPSIKKACTNSTSPLPVISHTGKWGQTPVSTKPGSDPTFRTLQFTRCYSVGFVGCPGVTHESQSHRCHVSACVSCRGAAWLDFWGRGGIESFRGRCQ